jgi:hypothetical protein
MRNKILLLALSIILTACNFSSGERIGTPTKIAKEGLIFKTTEVEMIKGGFNGGSGVMSNPFDFTIPSDDETSKSLINQALESGQEIKVTYHQLGFCPFTSQSHCVFSDSISLIKSSK